MLLKHRICFPIPANIAVQFGFPLVPIVKREAAVLRATVTEATIDKYSYLGWPKDNVSGSPKGENRALCNPVAEPQSVKFLAKRDFRSGIPRAV